jgi:C1A family cysteine protease
MRLNFKSDVPSDQDLIFDRGTDKLQFGHMITEYTPISQQGHMGSCAANAVADALEIVLANSHVDRRQNVPQVSRKHLYWVSRSWDGSEEEDAGTFLRSCLRQANHVGVCSEADWPYDENYRQAPSLESTIRASENKIGGYRRIANQGRERVLDLCAAMEADCPVVFGTGVGDEFLELYGDGVLGPPSAIKGYHALVVVGYRVVGAKVQFRIRNSWGEAWGDGGRCWFTEEYMTSGMTSDVWVVSKMEELA